MSAAATADAVAAPKAGGKKKLILMLSVVLLLVAVAGGGALFWVKSKQAAAAAAEEAEDGDSAPVKAHAKEKHDDKAVPTFVPLDPFTVNLADREAERYAQIGITLELDDAKVGDKIKAYMPAIRNNILLLLSQKTAADLLGREGKEKTAVQIQREASRALGVDVPDDEDEEAQAKPAASDADGEAKPKKKKKRKAPAEPLPIKRVHFSNFIIQ
ncbi:flagellar basal body-associated protein FliL [Aquabacterium sp. J223]|uniref:flagellar basal body-associated FliL family protein n=1 Tax=Aquabacterium sp. J223 TaxID=2898431 RepID=UPI0021AD50A0|nr:flagellar basal body-associated FliL family protein [Aquabacterium sp. J223]UUX94888.1 flagellar basal body-associated FliL family protein [Aquabacterium sp. J223]